MILRGLFVLATFIASTPIMVTCSSIVPTGPTATPTPTPAPTGTLAAYSGYQTPTPTSLPSAMPTTPSMLAVFYGEIEPNPQQTPNAYPTALAVATPSGGADVYCTLYPRTDGGLTGYMDVCVNAGATAEPVSLTPNQKTDVDSWDAQSNIADSPGFCPGYTPLSYNGDSFHNCAVVINLNANQNITFSGTSAIQPGGVRFYRLYNGTASSAASPTPVPVVTPTASPTPVPFTFPGDFPAQYEAAVTAATVPGPFDTPYPVPTATSLFTIAGNPACLETAPPYFTTNGRYIFVPYCPSATGGTYNATTTLAAGLFYNTIYSVTGPTPSPTTSPCHAALSIPQGSTYYGICLAANSASIVPIDVYPTPNPSPTYSAYPGMLDATCGASGTYLSQVGGPFPPASRQCMFLKNPMVGIIPATAQIDTNDTAYMANSGVGNGPANLTVVGTIQGAASSGYAYNWVTNGSPSIPVNMTCSGTCGTVGITPTWFPPDYQVQGVPDCHAEQVFYALSYVEDYWQVNKTNTPACASKVYSGAPFNSVAGTRIPFNSDGTYSQITASTISPGLGLIRGQDVLDTRVYTFPTAIQIAPPCTNNFWRYPAHGSDGGVGSSCSGTLPPNGAEIMYVWSGASGTPAQISAQTVAHVLSCGLDPLSQKWWLTLTIGFGHGAFITDTNGGGSTGYYIQTETDRDMTRFGAASSWQVIAKIMGVSISNGTYSLPISYGSGGCISNSDVHFVSPSTPNIQGTTLAP